MKSPKSVLVDAREFLNEPKRWVKGSLFTDRQGLATTSQKASCACLGGALMLSSGSQATEVGRDLYDASAKLVRDLLHGDNIVNFNDRPSTTHADVLAVLDKAIGNAGS